MESTAGKHTEVFRPLARNFSRAAASPPAGSEGVGPRECHVCKGILAPPPLLNTKSGVFLHPEQETYRLQYRNAEGLFQDQER
jgi:hypothetical protein